MAVTRRGFTLYYGVLFYCLFVVYGIQSVEGRGVNGGPWCAGTILIHNLSMGGVSRQKSSANATGNTIDSYRTRKDGITT